MLLVVMILLLLLFSILVVDCQEKIYDPNSRCCVEMHKIYQCSLVDISAIWYSGTVWSISDIFNYNMMLKLLIIKNNVTYIFSDSVNWSSFYCISILMNIIKFSLREHFFPLMLCIFCENCIKIYCYFLNDIYQILTFCYWYIDGPVLYMTIMQFCASLCMCYYCAETHGTLYVKGSVTSQCHCYWSGKHTYISLLTHILSLMGLWSFSNVFEVTWHI